MPKPKHIIDSLNVARIAQERMNKLNMELKVARLEIESNKFKPKYKRIGEVCTEIDPSMVGNIYIKNDWSAEVITHVGNIITLALINKSGYTTNRKIVLPAGSLNGWTLQNAVVEKDYTMHREVALGIVVAPPATSRYIPDIVESDERKGDEHTGRWPSKRAKVITNEKAAEVLESSNNPFDNPLINMFLNGEIWYCHKSNWYLSFSYPYNHTAMKFVRLDIDFKKKESKHLGAKIIPNETAIRLEYLAHSRDDLFKKYEELVDMPVRKLSLLYKIKNYIARVFPMEEFV